MNNQEKSTRRTEAAEASKKAILDAAEALFAQTGTICQPLRQTLTRWLNSLVVRFFLFIIRSSYNE